MTSAPAAPRPPRSATVGVDLFPTLRGYRAAWLRRDVVGGLSAGAVVVPQAMAYATIANLPVSFGLYTCMVPLVVYALLGGSRTLSMSTTSTIATLSASTLLAAGVAAGADDPARAVSTLTLLVGALLLLTRLLRLGSLVENISQATLVGIKAGVGATVAAAQLPHLLGVPTDPDATGFFHVLGSALGSLDQAVPATVALSVGSIAVLLVLGRVAPKVPAPLVVVAAGILLVAFAGLADQGVEVIEPIPPGLPLPVLPDLSLVGPLLAGASAIAIMAFLETVSVGRGVRRPDEPQIDPDQELLANGVAAVVGAFFRAMPPAGGFSQTAVSLRAGARSQAAGLVTATLAVLVALFLAPVLDDLPQATLGAMVVVATVSLIKVGDFVLLWRINRVEFVVAAVTTAIGLVAGLLPAVGVGVALTLLLVLRELDQPRVVPLVRTPQGGWAPVERGTTADDDATDASAVTHEVDREAALESGVAPGVLVLHLDAGLYTANTRPTVERILALARASSPTPRAVVLEAGAQRGITSTVLDGLTDLDRQLAGIGCTLVLARVPATTSTAAQASPWFAALSADGRVLPNVDAAVAAVQALPATTR
ncbi:SulP family inorganic anion transporter [Oerskovia enterophila]|uniref:SulP family inorganic anion transporter n=1 Tax=Oerskovia enterophila TaxID=43678 RepID=UPI003397500C